MQGLHLVRRNEKRIPSPPGEAPNSMEHLRWRCMVKRIPLTRGEFALVDDADYEWLSERKWWYRDCGANAYAGSQTRKNNVIRYLYMHREIMQPPRGMDVDHKNGNGLDNRRCNLRVCTRAQNLHNGQPLGGSSRHKGVSWSKYAKKWQAYIDVHGKRKHLGYFINEQDAARAYNEEALQNFGEFARINIID